MDMEDISDSTNNKQGFELCCFEIATFKCVHWFYMNKTHCINTVKNSFYKF